MTENNKILQIKNLNVSYQQPKNFSFFKKEYTQVLKNINIDIYEKSSTGIAGESGAGKSTFMRAILNLLKYSPSFVKTEGDIIWHIGSETFSMNSINKKDILRFRQLVQPVFQDPTASLNPKFTIGNIIEEPMKFLLKIDKKERKERVLNLLSDVGLDSNQISRYPNEFSVGQRQRINIARALASGPKVLVADEPVSSLDVSIQSQILNLLINLKSKYNLTIIFITHDLQVLNALCDYAAVFYKGNLVEYGSTENVFTNPQNEYTTRLLEINKN